MPHQGKKIPGNGPAYISHQTPKTLWGGGDLVIKATHHQLLYGM